MRHWLLLSVLLATTASAHAAGWTPAGRSGQVRAQSGIVGRVFFDLDGDGRFGPGDRGLAGVRILVGSGVQVETDEQGRYHVWRLPPGHDWLGSIPVELDPTSIPAGVYPTPDGRRLLQLTPLAVAAADFALRIPAGSSPAGPPPLWPKEPGSFALRPGPGGIELEVSVGPAPGCRMWQGERRLEPDARGRLLVRVGLTRGANRLVLARQCRDGKLEFWVAEYHWVPRRQGGDAVVPGRVTLAASCRLPAGERLPRSAGLVARCSAGSGEFSLTPGSARKLHGGDGTGTWLIPLHAGDNELGWRIGAAGQEPVVVKSSTRVSAVAVSGLLLGTFVYSHGSRGGNEIGGGLSGQLRAWLPAELRLYLGGRLEPNSGDFTHESFLPAWDNQVHERRPDPELGYPASGDESRLLDHNPSQGRYRLQVERRSGKLGWGEFTTDTNRPARVGDFSRALRGAFLSVDVAEQLAENPGEQPWWLIVEGFYARPGDNQAETMPVPVVGPVSGQPRPAHDELLDTGGTLYFLSHDRVVEGSVRVRVEWREARTGLARNSRRLEPDRDYQVDWLSGRLLLTRPLGRAPAAALLIGPAPGAGQWPVLVVDYEYVGEQLEPDQRLGGGTLQAGGRLGAGLELGGRVSLVEQAGSRDYRLLASQLHLELGRHGQLWLGYARSRGNPGMAPAYSTDGGLSFGRMQLSATEATAGEAWHAGARWEDRLVRARLEFRRWLSGYADTSLAAAYDANQALAEVSCRPWDWFEVAGAFHGAQMWPGRAPATIGDSGRLLDGQLQLAFRPFKPLQVAVAGGLEQAEGFWGSGARSLLGTRVSWQAVDWLELFAGYQQLLTRGSAGLVARDTTHARAGAVFSLAGWDLGLSGGWGPESGNALELAVNHREGEAVTFAATTFSLEQAPLRPLRVTSGQRAAAGGGVMVSAANVFSDENGLQARGQQAGVEMPLGGPWRAELSYQRLELPAATEADTRWQWLWSPFIERAGPLLAGPGRRNAVFGRLAYLTDSLALEAGSEYRLDEHLPLVDRPKLTHHRQVVARLAGRWKPAHGFELSGRLAWAETMSAAGGQPDPGTNSGRFLEASLGLAWRPAHPGWLTLLARVGAGQDRRPAEYLSDALPLLASDWLSGSVALHLSPFSFLQPSLVVLPWYRRVLTRPRADAPTVGQWGMLGLLRLGSEIAWGLGLAGEVRLGYAGQGPETVPELKTGLEIGYAAEVFFQVRQPEVGLLRLGVGYSFSDLPDPTLEGAALLTGQEGVFVRLEAAL